MYPSQLEVATMPEDKSRTKWMPKELSLNGECPEKKQTDLLSENSILELISMGAPLPDVLNKLCTAIDLQIGNVVSVILLANDAEHDLQTIARNALQYGLHVFWSENIYLQGEDILGSFEMYCCVSRMPTAFEIQLIERVTHLAALAICRHNAKMDFETLYRDWKNALQRDVHEETQLN